MRLKEGDKHNAILNAAIKVFCRDGFDRAQVASVANVAGVATGSVYLYFKSKDDVLDGLFVRFWTGLQADVEALTIEAGEGMLEALLGQFFDHLSKDRALAAVYLHEHHRFLERKTEPGFSAYQKCIRLGERAFARGVKEGVFAKGLDVAFTRAFLFGGVRAALEFWVGNANISAKQVRTRMLRLALASLTGGQGAAV